MLLLSLRKPRINSESFQYPWAVAIIRPESEDKFITHCSGSVLKDRWILTAAHCFDNLIEDGISKLKIKLGADDWKKEPSIFDTAYDQTHDIESFAVHPNYDSSLHYYDVAVIETKDKIDFTQGVQPICLPEAPNAYVDSRKGYGVIVAGFGHSTAG